MSEDTRPRGAHFAPVGSKARRGAVADSEGGGAPGRHRVTSEVLSDTAVSAESADAHDGETGLFPRLEDDVIDHGYRGTSEHFGSAAPVAAETAPVAAGAAAPRAVAHMLDPEDDRPQTATFVAAHMPASEERPQSATSAAAYMAAPEVSRPRPDETAVFIALAEASRIESAAATARPDETAQYIGLATPQVQSLERSMRPDAPLPASPMRTAGARVADGHAARVGTAAPAVAQAPAPAPQAAEVEETEEEVEQLAARKANGASLLVLISRITGFGRTMAQANALSGALMAVASCYTVASTLPNFLYELVVGGMLITSFLPVYLAVRKRAGAQGAAAYASNLLSLVLIVMGVLSVLCFAFAVPLVWTQSAGASADFDFDLAVWFFRFFAFEVVLYGASSIISGVLNAERDYVWSNAAPIVNNIITIASFSIYAFVVKRGIMGWEQALIILAVGNPLGVASQVLIQVPALRRHGVRLRFRVDIHDPAIKETLAIGLPTLLVTFASFPTNAVQSSCALQVTANGAAIAYYSRVWYVLPFSILAIPISTTMFTELSNFRVAGRMDAYRRTVASGIRKISFTMIPCVLLLAIFAPQLIAIIGGFDASDAALTATYLQVQAIALPFYGISTYLQKVCSSLMRMKFYAIATCVAAAVQVAFCIVLTPVYGLYVVPASSTFFFIAVDVVTIWHIRREIGPFGMGSVVRSSLYALVFGAIGAAAGWLILHALTAALGPASGMLRNLLYTAVAGIPALLVAFGGAYAAHVSEAPFFDALFGRVGRMLHRAR